MSLNRMHSICDDCWHKRNPGIQPFREVDPARLKCCFCGQFHTSGIWLRAEPSTTKCSHSGTAVPPDEDDTVFDSLLCLISGLFLIAEFAIAALLLGA